ncbi:hypothetical protein PL9631_450102 [Planktothrix paucivesiculata PCC 9631]|uniref:Uncharacterized protein n=1 Tax=Planktothrix paucivesiculata PCC 9631 TaxID=671071 RepID=A0A7Z9BPF5_9CYAN|nr:hypothetical protein PL9631_450102 [Planktothrix paucivesiculata PCC 9631]
MLIIINLNKPAQPHNRNQYKPGFINIKFWWVGRVYQDYLSDLKNFARINEGLN